MNKVLLTITLLAIAANASFAISEICNGIATYYSTADTVALDAGWFVTVKGNPECYGVTVKKWIFLVLSCSDANKEKINEK